MDINYIVICRDIAVMDKNGYGQIVGRMKDMIIRGGENIYPRLVLLQLFLILNLKVN